MVKIISWNIAGRVAPWHALLEMDADIVLLQEARQPPDDVAARIEVDPSPWDTAGAGVNRPWKAAIAKLSDRVKVEWIEAKSILDAEWNEFAVSRPGTLAAAIVDPVGGEPFLAASMYSAWEGLVQIENSIVADGSAHRLVSDLSRLVMCYKHPVIAAGDLNILYGYGEYGDQFYKGIYATVFDRMKALGLPFVGPQYPNGRQADPWPEELPKESLNVPTYHHNLQTPETATRQLDFVFASTSISGSVQTRALNNSNEWGPSDHCRVEIEF